MWDQGTKWYKWDAYNVKFWQILLASTWHDDDMTLLKASHWELTFFFAYSSI